MKKLIGLSLVACATLLTTTASAKDLSEAIKGVDVSGTIAYRYQDYETLGSNGQTTTNNYKVAINTASKVNDDITANTRIIVEDFGRETNSADAAADVELSEANFAYSGIENATITVGKQAINSQFTVARDSIGVENFGTGAVATYNVANVNLSAAYFNNSNIDKSDLYSGNYGSGVPTAQGGENIVVAGIATSVANVNLDAQYIDIDTIANGYTVGVSASYDVSDIKLSSYARYSAMEDDDNTDNSLWKAGISAQMGIFGAYVAYGQTDEEGGAVALDASANTGFDEHWRVTLTGVQDASVLYTGVSAQITDKVNVAFKYSDLDVEEGNTNWQDEDEIYFQGVYQMSSNFFTYVRLGQLDRANYDDTINIGRLHVQYSF